MFYFINKFKFLWQTITASKKKLLLSCKMKIIIQMYKLKLNFNKVIISIKQYHQNYGFKKFTNYKRQGSISSTSLTQTVSRICKVKMHKMVQRHQIQGVHYAIEFQYKCLLCTLLELLMLVSPFPEVQFGWWNWHLWIDCS